MNIPKAIEILTLMGTPEFDGHTEDILAARKLGIEALKRLYNHRDEVYFKYDLPLPGETEN